MARHSSRGRQAKSDINPLLVAIFILITAIIGVIAFFIGEVVYNACSGAMWQPLAIGLYFLVFLVVYFVLFFLVNAFSGTVDVGSRGYSRLANASTRNRTKQRRKNQSGLSRGYSTSRARTRGNSGAADYVKPVLIALGLAVAFFALSILFDYLYELGETRVMKPTSYIFLIDDSGSMLETDPEFLRVEAIHDIMSDADPDMPYAVYSFTSDVTMLKDMSTYDEGDEFVFYSDGSTDIIKAVSGVLDDIENGKIDGGDSPRILLLSDGNSFAFGKGNVIRRCNRNGVTICTVSFPNYNDLLKDLANRTGGVYVDSDNTDDLNEMMEGAITANISARDILSYRLPVVNDGLYAFLRILFLIILGTAWSFFKYVISSFSSSEIPPIVVLVVSGVLCILGAILLEVCSQYSTDITPRFIFVLLWALSVGQIVIQQRARRRGRGASLI